MKGYVDKYYCINCNKKIRASLPKCPYCGEKQPYEARAKALHDKIVNIECPHCGCKTSFFREGSYFDEAYCADCGRSTYEGEYKKPVPQCPAPPKVQCPYCGSTNTDKISAASRIVSVATLGILSKKIGKQWHCNNCKSDF